MSAGHDAPHCFGQSLIEITPEPVDDLPADFDLVAGAALQECGANSPFVAAVQGLVRALGPRPCMSVEDARLCLGGIVGHDLTPPIRAGVRDALLFLALMEGYVDVSVDDGRRPDIVRGPQAWLPEREPHYCWVDSLTTMLFGMDLVAILGTRERWYDARLRLLPPLLFQYVTRCLRDADVGAITDALHAEVVAASAASRRAPRRADLDDRVLGVLEMLRLFDVVGPVRPVGERRLVDLTGAGPFAWLIAMVALDGELPPELDAMAREQGYLRADGGYLRPQDVPVPIAFN